MKSTLCIGVLALLGAFFLASTVNVTANKFAHSKAKYAGFGQRVEGKVNVHLIPHTHDDVGWLKTVDEYYYGANNTIQQAAVQYVITNVLGLLKANPNRKFIYIEQAFFQRWFHNQDAATQADMRTLVAEDRLVFINGGWCMHDEAGPHYIDMVDQTTVGHRFITKEFGTKANPKVTWQIDPFGHSANQGSMLGAQSGFEGMYVGRIDRQDYSRRYNSKNLETVWRPSETFGDKAQIFFGMYVFGNYGPPNVIDFRNTPPVQYDPTLEDYNVPQYVETFVQQVQGDIQHIKGNDLMYMMGSDFEYGYDAAQWFTNMDKLIDAVNQDGRINVFYSDPVIYTRAKQAYTNETWEVKTDDFFPYSDGSHAYWTGYFTSRPALKHYVRKSSAFLMAGRQLEVLSSANGNGGTDLSFNQVLEQFLAVTQHHDAVAGTAKQHVSFDYAKLLSKGSAVTSDGMAKAFTKLSAKKMMSDGDNTKLTVEEATPATAIAPLLFTQCPLRNVSICDVSQNNAGVAINVYNQLARTRQELVYVPVDATDIAVYDSNGNEVVADLLSTFNTAEVDGADSFHGNSSAYNVVFLASVPAMGFSTYFIQPVSPEAKAAETKTKLARSVHMQVADAPLENDQVSVTFFEGKPVSIKDKNTGAVALFDQSFLWYKSFEAQGSDQDYQNSGAYIFRPRGDTPIFVAMTAPNTTLVAGQLVMEARQNIANGGWLNQTVRLPLAGDVTTQRSVEFQYSIGSIPIDDKLGKELISKFTTDLKTNKTYYTDSNAREFQKRVRYYKATYVWDGMEPVASNYYPMNAAIYVNEDDVMQPLTKSRIFSVQNDRSQGCASIQDGSVEIMIHRRILADDGRGVGEPLNETTSFINEDDGNDIRRTGPGMPLIGSHFVQFSTSEDAVVGVSGVGKVRESMPRVYAPFVVSFAPMAAGGKAAVAAYIAEAATTWSGMAMELPTNVDVMTLMKWTNGTVLLRLAHQLAVGEDAKLSGPVTVDLNSLFKSFTISSVQELSLTANEDKQAFNERMKNVQWNTVESDGQTKLTGNTFSEQAKQEKLLAAGTVVLGPMEIRTLQISLKSK